MDDIVSKFSNHLKSALTRALCLVVDTKNENIAPKHLLWALGTQQGCVASEILLKAGLNIEDLRAFAGEAQQVPQSIAIDRPLIPALSEESKSIIEKAVLTANLHEHRYIGTEHLLAGMLQVSPDDVSNFLLQHQVNTTILNQNLTTVFKTTSSFPEFPEKPESVASILSDMEQLPLEELDADPSSDQSKTPALDYFTQELTELEAAADTDPVIGRSEEIDRVMKILCRRTKNNPILVGDPGVGKTAIVEGLAKKIVEQDVPPALAEKQIYRLDLASLIAGTMYRGEFESRLRQLIDEISERPEIILFIDEVHTIMGAGAASGSLDAANILKPALARGAMRCIGATTPVEFKKHIEVDGALERRFQQVRVNEPSAEETLQILSGVQSYYEEYHEVQYTPQALQAAVSLSKRYMTNLQFPDKAIDLLDEAGAAAVVKKRTHSSSPASLKRELTQVLEEKDHAVREERFADAVDLKEREEELTIALANLPSSKKHTSVPTIDERDIVRVVASICGIDEKTISSTIQKRLKNLESKIQRTVFGQEEAISRIAGAVRRAMFGLHRAERPLASFLLTGPSGVGKTQITKTVAETVFSGSAPLLRLDMSEYSAPFTASKLIGSPAGYVGYREENVLTDHVKQHPRSVILFDEIEKAHSDVHHLLLQILDNGFITDSTGRQVNFRNTLIFMTSNVGSERFERGDVGFATEGDDASNIDADIRKQLEDRFAKEFLNRIDHICVFNPLSNSALQKIASQRLAEIIARFNELGITLKSPAQVTKWIASGVDPKFGGRDVHRRIEKYIEQPLINTLLKDTEIENIQLRATKAGINIISS